ncbi:MAG: tripartite tricarboxylate transporter substrate binding protein, partial [Polaromonas sp.]|nr:tripartite tricarboxylate transporter substrate binding protein [Polaromonas sp.]
LAMIADEVQLTFATLASNGPQLKAGKLKAIAVMSNQRLTDLPRVPTSAEAGFPELVFGNWWVMAAPAGTDPKIVAKLDAEIRTALADPATKVKLVEIGQVTLSMPPAESAAFIRAESARYKALIERNGIKLEQ